MAYTAQQKLDALDRELKYRRRVFAYRVEKGQMTQELADYQIDIFEAIRADYERAAEKERLL
jgi:hypothetical protein